MADVLNDAALRDLALPELDERLFQQMSCSTQAVQLIWRDCSTISQHISTDSEIGHASGESRCSRRARAHR